MSRSPALLAVLAVLAVAVVACATDAAPSATPPATLTPTATPAEVATLIAAGDIASCEREGDNETGAMIEEIDGTVAALGDLVYPVGSDEAYEECYGPAWGSFLDRTRPAIGNHDLAEDGGLAYRRYFGSRAGPPGQNWYSYELGEWHVVVLDSHCEIVECEPGSEQHDWLVAELEASDAQCTVAYWHHPRFSSGPHGPDELVTPFWEVLHDAGAELVLNGHEHLYERFAPQDPDGEADAAGIRQFTVGTGGYSLFGAEDRADNSEVLIDDEFGVLVLTLRPDGYDWSFLTIDGDEEDAGSAECH